VLGNPLIPARGDILDRNGIPLARTIDAWTIAVHPNKLVGDPKELALKLAELMPEKERGAVSADPEVRQELHLSQPPRHA
jgi:cell division protein FtsI (penicillin-binding protein 3)